MKGYRKILFWLALVVLFVLVFNGFGGWAWCVDEGAWLIPT